MIIENGILKHEGFEYELPEYWFNTKVKMYSVPSEYINSGYFVTVYGTGIIEEYPACASSDIVYIGSLEYQASENAILNKHKEEKLRKLQTEKIKIRDGGLILNNIKWDTDERAQAAYVKFFLKLQVNQEFIKPDWKASEGIWTEMNATVLNELSAALEQHETLLFTWQRNKEAEINACETIEQLKQVSLSYE